MKSKRGQKRRFCADIDEDSVDIRAKSPFLSNDNDLNTSLDDQVSINGFADNDVNKIINANKVALQLINGGNTLTPIRSRNKDNHRKSLLTPLADDSFVANSDNGGDNLENENLEKQQRLQHRIVAHRRSIMNGTISTPDRTMISGGLRQSLESTNSIPKMNPVQLKDHYSVCIKLSATNKINPKNAFSLHLIDLMSDIIKSSNDGQVNFRLAGSALDAGAKIYSSRVDCVHSEAQKVASGLVMALDKEKKGRKGDKDEEEDEINDVDENGQIIDNKKKKRRQNKSGKTIAQNLDSIGLNKLETNIEIDPVFHKISSEFDAGSPLSLLMVNLNCDAKYQMLLQSNKQYNSYYQLDDEYKRSIKHSTIKINQFRRCFENINSTDVEICSELKDFNFRQRNEDNSILLGQDLSDLRCASEMKNSYIYNTDIELSDDGNDFDDCRDGDLNYDDDDDEDCLLPPVTRKSFLKAVNLEAVQDLVKILSMKPGDYTYFNRKLNCTWAGPNHWKKNPFFKFQLAKKSQDQLEEVNKQKKKTKKELIERNFAELELNPKFNKKESDKEKLKLKVTTLKKWDSDSDNQLPIDHCYCLSNLIHPFNLPEVTFKTASGDRIPIANAETEKLDDKSDNEANFDNDLFDRPNSPDISINHNDDYSDDTEGDGFPTDIYGDSQPSSILLPFTGDNLVEQPQSVQQIKLPYTTVAKKMDVKRLKKAMWDILSKSSHTLPETIPEKVMKTDNHFTDLYKNIQPRITSSMKSNLSPQIAFVTLLHLANEKCLKLNGSESLENIEIIQKNLVSNESMVP